MCNEFSNCNICYVAECNELVAELGLMVQPLGQGSIAESQLLMVLPHTGGGLGLIVKAIS